jgi:hypothetical protein
VRRSENNLAARLKEPGEAPHIRAWIIDVLDERECSDGVEPLTLRHCSGETVIRPLPPSNFDLARIDVNADVARWVADRCESANAASKIKNTALQVRLRGLLPTPNKPVGQHPRFNQLCHRSSAAICTRAPSPPVVIVPGKGRCPDIRVSGRRGERLPGIFALRCQRFITLGYMKNT